MITLTEYAQKVEAMRNAQKEYFINAAIAAKKRTPDSYQNKKHSLLVAKALEKHVDDITSQMITQHPDQHLPYSFNQI